MFYLLVIRQRFGCLEHALAICDVTGEGTVLFVMVTCHGLFLFAGEFTARIGTAED